MPFPLRASAFLAGLLIIISSHDLSAQHVTDSQSISGRSSLRLSADLPVFLPGKGLSADIYTSLPALFAPRDSLFLFYSLYKYGSKGDSTLLCSLSCSRFSLKAGAAAHTLLFAGKDGVKAWCLPVFNAILQKTGAVPPGSYKAFIRLKSGDSTASFTAGIPYLVDSTLPLSSPVRKELSAALVPEQKKGIGSLLLGKEIRAVNGASGTAAKAIERSRHKMDRLLSARGLSPQVQRSGTKEYINLYYQDWFVGRYETEAGQSIKSQVAQQESRLAGGITATGNSELEGYRSLLSQVKELTRQKKEDKEIKGRIGLSGSWSTAQPEYSTQDNNYYELRGDIEAELLDIPVEIEGYYTTQDAHRTVKSSYVRFHYDAEKAKGQLLKLIGGFKQQYGSTVAKGKGLEQVYGSYLSGLKDSKGAMLSGLRKETGVYSLDGSNLNTSGLKEKIKAGLEAKMASALKDTTALAGAAEGSLDSSAAGRAAIAKTKAAEARAKLIEDSATHMYDRAMKRYEQMEALEKKIEKYEGLLESYKTNTYFDSVLAYSKVANIEHPDEASYKQLAKSASGLLPEGKAKTFVAGLTSLDAGIFPKYVSKYTMAGQQVKGLDLGYDIGFAQIGLTVGKTEYAGRDGSLYKYTTYGARALFRPLKGQKVGLIYYGYTPSRSAFSGNNDFYKNIDIALPTFKAPVHIVSATYEGIIAKSVHVEGEAATSFRNGGYATLINNSSSGGSDGSTKAPSLLSGFDADRLAWHLSAEGNIPKTTLALTGSYEHGGKDFQNSTLPVLISGTDLCKAGVKGELWKGFLSMGLEYNHMQQSSFYSTGGNSRWGFEIATHSKQYPSVALSYKPFATFRSSTDTLGIPQRPLLGAVWAGKASYQVKRGGGVSWRFSAVYNKSTSKSDSVSYGSDLVQVNVIYTTKKWMAMVSGGQSALATGGLPADTLSPAHIRTMFGTAALSCSLGKSLNVTGGTDIGFAHYGLSKYGLNGGLSYKMSRVPLSVRLSGRLGGYRLPGYSGQSYADASTSAGAGVNATTAATTTTTTNSGIAPLHWQRLYGGGIDLVWQFKMKVNK